jgi:DNA repair protein RadC
MYKIPVYRIQLVRDSDHAVPEKAKAISSPKTAAEIATSYLRGVDREHFIVLLLDTKHNVIGINTVSIGCLNASIVHPREVFKPAIAANAAAIIVAHNHPSGDPEPSPEDGQVSRRLRDAGEMLGIPVLDSLIVTGDSARYVSLKERGLV